MSDTAKSVVLLAKSCRPVAEPVEVKTTCRPCWLVSAIHWLTALEAQLEPAPEIWAWLLAAPAGTAAAISARHPARAPGPLAGRAGSLIVTPGGFSRGSA